MKPERPKRSSAFKEKTAIEALQERESLSGLFPVCDTGLHYRNHKKADIC